jgi:hypothetical protein
MMNVPSMMILSTSTYRTSSWQSVLYVQVVAGPDGKFEHHFEVRDQTAEVPNGILLDGKWCITSENGNFVLVGDEKLILEAQNSYYGLIVRHGHNVTAFDHHSVLLVQAPLDRDQAAAVPYMLVTSVKQDEQMDGGAQRSVTTEAYVECFGTKQIEMNYTFDRNTDASMNTDADINM